MRIQTGRRIDLPADDPFGTSSTVNMRSLKQGLEQYDRNISMVRGIVGTSEATLGEVETLLQRASEIALRGANDAQEQAGRDGLAAEVQELQRRLVDMSNTRGPMGQYLFAGQRTDTQPFNVSGSTLAYQGDANAIRVETGPNSTITANSVLDQAFVATYDRLEQLRSRLLGGEAARISNESLRDLKESQATFRLERGRIGVKMQTLDEQRVQGERRRDELQVGISDIEEIDMAEAIVDYQQKQMAYEAAMRVAAQGFNLSLMDFING
jgi:flagellar hook-associated protein 3 FlgL